MRRKDWFKLIVPSAFLLLCTSCSDRAERSGDYTRPCAELRMIDAFHSEAKGATSVAAIRDWILTEFRIGADQLKETVYDDPAATDLQWSSDGVRYTLAASTATGFEFTVGIVAFDYRPPAFEHLQQCLGWRDPDFYRAAWGSQTPTGKAYSLEVYYTDHGVRMLSGRHFFEWYVPEEPPLLEPTLPVDVIKLARPAPIADLFAAVTGGPFPSDPFQPKPWPGSWQNLEYLTLP